MNLPLLFLLCLPLVHCHISSKHGNTNHQVKKVIIEKEFGSSSSSSSSSSSWSSEEHHGPPRRHRHRRRHGPRPSPKPHPTPASKGCPADWMTFERPQGKWCVKVFNGPATQAQAVQLCQAQNANLTGVQNNNEREQIAAAGRTVVNLNGGGEADIWLGASRRPNCPQKSSCGAMDTFEWTDGSATGIAGFKWGNTEPNGIVFPNWDHSQQWGQQNCLVQLINGSGDRTKFGYWHGEMDDQHCQNSFRLYACGKRG